MSVSARTFLIPGVALATAGTMALAPVMTTAPVAAPALPAVPSIHVEQIALAGIGRDIYNEITEFVQYTVSSAQFWIDLIPVVGPPLADQLGILYFQGIQPMIADTVYYASDLIADPWNFVSLTFDYGSNVFYNGYTFVSAEAQAIGLPGLPPIPAPPPLASVKAPSRGAAAAVRVAEAATEDVTATEAAPEAVPVSAVRGRSARAAASTPRPAAARAAASTEADTAGDAAPSPKRQSAKASRGADRAGAAD